jgi:hypothetical protein
VTFLDIFFTSCAPVCCRKKHQPLLIIPNDILDLWPQECCFNHET